MCLDSPQGSGEPFQELLESFQAQGDPLPEKGGCSLDEGDRIRTMQDPAAAAERLRTAFALFEAGVEMMRQTGASEDPVQD